MNSRCPDIYYGGTALAPSATYYWRIKFWDTTNIEGGWSATQQFTTGSSFAPAVTTSAATTVTFTSAVVNGTVNPNGAATDVWFEYGITTDYTISTTAQTISSGTEDVVVSATISGLLVGATYNFRVSASNTVGTIYSSNLSFTTFPVQEAYAKASNTGEWDAFGYSVAISGDTMVVGAGWEDSGTTGINSTPDESAEDAGAVYVFTRSGDVWSQQAYLKPEAVGSTQAFDSFGISVAISGDTLVVGAFCEDSSTTGINSAANEASADSGAAYVFVRSAGVWSQQAYLKADAVGDTQESDQFGISVGISGDTIVVGAWNEDSGTLGINSTADEASADSGAAYVFTRSGTTWSQQAYLKPGTVGDTQEFDQFGTSVAISGDTIVVGAYNEDSDTLGINSVANDTLDFNSGAAYVFTRSGTTWSQEAYLKPDAVGDTQAGDAFGFNVAISGDTLVVGACNEDSDTTGIDSAANEASADSGAAYVFVRSAGVWSQQTYLKPDAVGTTQESDQFGRSLAISGDAIVVGAYSEDSNTSGVNSTANDLGDGSGAAYVFARADATWSQLAYVKASNPGTSDYFGFSVAIDLDTWVIGARDESSNATGINGNQADNNAPASGAAYIFRVR